MGNKHTITAGNAGCNHKWIKRSKKHFEILERACTECGQVELHSESDEIDSLTAKKLMKVN